MAENPHLGDQGEFWFASKPGCNWFWHPPKRDFGKDGIVVIRDGSDLHNLEFAVQVKTTRKPTVRNAQVIKYGIKKSTVAYWLANPIPTLIVAIDIESQSGWYAWHMDLFGAPNVARHNATKSVTIRIPESNRMDDQGWDDIRARLRGFYSGLQRAFAVADRSYRLTPAVKALLTAVRNLASVAHLPDAAAKPHPDLEPILALHEQVQHRDILVAVRSLLPVLETASEPKRQIELWIESYEKKRPVGLSITT